MKTWNSGALITPGGQSVTDGGWASGEHAAQQAQQDRQLAVAAAARAKIVKQDLAEIHELARAARSLTVDPAAAEALQKIEQRTRHALENAYGIEEHEKRIAFKDAVRDQETVMTWGGKARSIQR